MEYTIFIRKIANGFVAVCPLIPEANAQGQTFDECLNSIKAVLEQCVKARTERGEEIPDESAALKMTITV
jgi:predicted RNase H-like HicB family nuclease